jgi:putative redox protein
MTAKTIHANVIETGDSAYAVTIDVSGHMLKGDEPTDVGGGNLGPTPYDLLTAALGECTAMTIRWYANQNKWPVEKIEVKLTHHKEDRQDIFTKHIKIYGDELTQEQREKLVKISATCPVQRTLEGRPLIKTISL